MSSHPTRTNPAEDARLAVRSIATTVVPAVTIRASQSASESSKILASMILHFSISPFKNLYSRADRDGFHINVCFKVRRQLLRISMRSWRRSAWSRNRSFSCRCHYYTLHPCLPLYVEVSFGSVCHSRQMWFILLDTPARKSERFLKNHHYRALFQPTVEQGTEMRRHRFPGIWVHAIWRQYGQNARHWRSPIPGLARRSPQVGPDCGCHGSKHKPLRCKWKFGFSKCINRHIALVAFHSHVIFNLEKSK